MTGDDTDPVWPEPRFPFRVRMAGEDMQVREVHGLDIDDGAGGWTASRFGNITLKNAVFPEGGPLWQLWRHWSRGPIRREDLRISLMDDAGSATIIWTIRNAFPVKVQGTSPHGNGTNVTIDLIELAHEGIAITNP